MDKIVDLYWKRKAQEENGWHWKLNIPKVLEEVKRILKEQMNDKELVVLKLDLEEADTIEDAREVLEQYAVGYNSVIDRLHEHTST